MSILFRHQHFSSIKIIKTFHITELPILFRYRYLPIISINKFPKGNYQYFPVTIFFEYPYFSCTKSINPSQLSKVPILFRYRKNQHFSSTIKNINTFQVLIFFKYQNFKYQYFSNISTFPSSLHFQHQYY